MTLHTPPAFDGGDDLAAHIGDVTGANPDDLGIQHVVPVTVVDEVSVKERRARTIVVESVPLDVAIPQRILNESRQRSRAMLFANGGNMLIGTRFMQTFIVSQGSTFEVDATCELWALGASAGVTANIYSEHRDG